MSHVPAARPGHDDVPRRTARVRWFSADRGFGFLTPDDGSDDVFVTYTALPGDGFRSLAEGDRVSFVQDHDEHGPTAASVLPDSDHPARPAA